MKRLIVLMALVALPVQPVGNGWHRATFQQVRGIPRVPCVEVPAHFVTHRDLECGSWVTVAYHGRPIRARVVSNALKGPGEFGIGTRTWQAMRASGRTVQGRWR